ncbi:MAG: hypothetical protein ACO280_05025 [Pseudohongiellaceae bacterium]
MTDSSLLAAVRTAGLLAAAVPAGGVAAAAGADAVVLDGFAELLPAGSFLSQIAMVGSPVVGDAPMVPVLASEYNGRLACLQHRP